MSKKIPIGIEEAAIALTGDIFGHFGVRILVWPMRHEKQKKQLSAFFFINTSTLHQGKALIKQWFINKGWPYVRFGSLEKNVQSDSNVWQAVALRDGTVLHGIHIYSHDVRWFE